jgi:WD40 repeat protein
MEFLQHPAVDSITTISWSPDGTKLAVGGGLTPNLLIWDVVFQNATVLKKGAGGGTAQLEWSPDGRYLMQICTYVEIH